MTKTIKIVLVTILMLLLAGSFVATAMWFGVATVWQEPLSNIGRGYYFWFYRWAVLLCAALTLGFVMGGIRMRIPFKKWGLLFYGIVAVSGTANLISNFRLETDFVSMMIHLWFSLTFGSTGLLALAILLLVAFIRCKQKRCLVVLAIHVLMSLWLLTSIIIFYYIAGNQIITLLWVIATTAWVNFGCRCEPKKTKNRFAV